MASYGFLRIFKRDADPAVLLWQRRRVDNSPSVIEAQVEGRPFVIGDHSLIADLSLCAFMSFSADETGYDLPSTNPTRRHGRAIRNGPGWKAPFELLPGQRLPRYA